MWYVNQKQRKQRCECGTLINKDGMHRRDVPAGCDRCKRPEDFTVTAKPVNHRGSTDGYEKFDSDNR